MPEHRARLAEAITRIPSLSRFALESLSPVRLGGLTNYNYLVHVPDQGRQVLRLAGNGTIEYIDRKIEKYNAMVAVRAGVNVVVRHFDEQDGTMLTDYLESETMSIKAFRDKARVQRAALAFRRLHDCGELFSNDFDLFPQLDRYTALLQNLGCALPKEYGEVKELAGRARQALSLWPIQKVACHCDPLHENFLDTGTKMFIIDFEYAGNHDPMWDLGDFSVECEFTPEQDQVLLESYFGRPAPAFEVGRMTMHKALCDLLWALWGLVQHAYKNPAEDFWQYGVNRLRRGRSLMKSAHFRESLKAVERGPDSGQK